MFFLVKEEEEEACTEEGRLLSLPTPNIEPPAENNSFAIYKFGD